MAWYCDRGVAIHRLVNNWNSSELICLCPPGYYGRLCQYQNQRVSLTLKLKIFSNWHITRILVVTLRNDQDNQTESNEQFYYYHSHDCAKKFNMHLLYSSRPKNTSKTYSVRIDIYNEDKLEHHASWSFPIEFPFLPVYRMAVQLEVPTKNVVTEMCERLNCGIHGHCSQYANNNVSYCHCYEGWTGLQCDIQYKCDCSSDSICLGPNICLCPLGKLGPRCYFKFRMCPCQNGGTCMQNVKHMNQDDSFYCICPKGYYGVTCEKNATEIMISFASDLEIPLSINVHFIQVFDVTNPHEQTTIFTRIPVDQDILTIYRSDPFHIIFVEVMLPKTYYLTFLQKEYKSVSKISSKSTLSNRCPFISEVFNSSFARLHLIRRMKHYHIPCKERKNLACFYDDSHMCICNDDLRQANCFTFNHSKLHNCTGQHFCENNGYCLQDNAKCPTEFKCICDECYFGSRCQFSTKRFILSLDIILGHRIRQFVSFSEQNSSIKIIISIVTFILACGVVSGTLSILTFQAKKVRQVACGYYLLMSSYTSIILIVMFALKFYFLIVFQMALVTNRNYLLFNCKIMDFLLKILSNSVDWLHTCVGIDRAIETINEKKSNRNKSRRSPKWIISSIFIFTTLSHIQDPIYRRLIDDEEDKRTWCILEFSPFLRVYNSVMLILHIAIPFMMNITSALIIIINIARRRSFVQKQNPYKEHLRQQFYKFKHLLVGPLVLIMLGSPQLAILFMSRCLKSIRNPWLFVIAYFISFISPMLIFFIFVLPSNTYKTEFSETIKQMKRRIRSH